MEVALDDLGGLGGVEPGGVVALASCAGAGDGAGGERLGAFLGDHGVHAPGDRVPDQLGQSRGEAERVQHDTGAISGGAVPDGQQQVVGLGEGDQGGAGGGEQGGDEQVQGLAGPLRADDAGGAVPRHPQVAAARFVGDPEPPPHLAWLHPSQSRHPGGVQVGADDRRDPAQPAGTEQGVRFGRGWPCRAPVPGPTGAFRPGRPTR